MAYSGRLAIIAGGLGGLGTAIAKRLRTNGAKLALLYAPFESANKNAILQNTYGHDPTSKSWPKDISTHECDITSEESVKSAFAQLPVDEAFPSILINSAGYVTVAPLEETSAEEAARNILPNLLGPFIVSREFFQLYRTQQQKQNEIPGRIVSISSQAAHVALPGHGPYCASKAGLLGLNRCMALEWAQYGITSNTVSPTVVMTSLGKKAWADPVKRDAMLNQIPTGRFAEPDEVAEAVEWLCRDGSGMVNGADIRLDGGFTIR